MKYGVVIKLFVLGGVLLSLNVLASEPKLSEAKLAKSDLKRIKILSYQTDRINFFLTDNSQNLYRIPDLSQSDASNILDQIKNHQSLSLKTTPNQRGYLDVYQWRVEN